MTWYCVYRCSSHDIVSIRVWNNKRHPIYCPKGELWGVFCEDFWENGPRHNGTALYCITMMPHMHDGISNHQQLLSCLFKLKTNWWWWWWFYLPQNARVPEIEHQNSTSLAIYEVNSSLWNSCIEVWTKFRILHFQIHFLEWKCCVLSCH